MLWNTLRRLPGFLGGTLACLLPLLAAHAQPKRPLLERLTPGKVVRGFRALAVYLDAADRPMGARFRHLRTGFTFDALEIQSVPQGFVWVNTPPTSDKGEPHTQEHLLLGKGNKGRSVANCDAMWLVRSSAMTMQWRTCYHFNTTAGPDVFYRYCERSLDALLHPDYTDEEIHREVRNFGVTENPTDKTLRLEEKGTVYNEMVSAADDAGSLLWRAQDAALYGKHHPLYYLSGGTPEGLRQITPQDIRRFHRQHYVLSNMGMIGAFPQEMPLEAVLTRLDAMLCRLQPPPRPLPVPVPLNGDAPIFPAPQGMPPGSLQIVPYPEKNAQKPGSVQFAWPATRTLDTKQQLLLELFLSNLASDASTPLYKRFVDSKTRAQDLGATGVYGFLSEDQGFPVILGLSDVAQSHINPREIAAIRREVQVAMRAISAWKDGSPELASFNAQIRSRLVEEQRSLSKFLNSPPGFGVRWNDGGWMTWLLRLERGGAFRRSITLKPETAFVSGLLADRRNFWRHYLAAWHLTDTIPYAVATRPSPELAEEEARATQARLHAEGARLQRVYGVGDEQAALRRYQADYAAATARLEASARKDPPVRFVATPPMTLDDQLNYRVTTLPGGVPLVASTFESMTGATTGLALRLDGVPEDDLLYLSLLPDLLTESGVLENGKPVPYEQMLERWRKEILSLNASFGLSFQTGRCELVLRGAGNDPGEARRAVAWMETILLHPDWRPENLPRLRDVVDQALSALRNTRQGYEENWVRGVSAAYWRQDHPLLLTTGSFLTRTHNAQRLRWLLKGDLFSGALTALCRFLETLGTAGKDTGRADLAALLNALQNAPVSPKFRQGDGINSFAIEPSAVCPAATYRLEAPPSQRRRSVLGKGVGGLGQRYRGAGETREGFHPVVRDWQPVLTAFAALPSEAATLAREAAKDLAQDLPDLPDSSLTNDWAALCAEIRHDVQIPPAQTLNRLNAVRQTLLKTGAARLFVIGSAATQKRLQPSLSTLLASLDTAPFQPVAYSRAPLITAHLREREPEAADPVYAGLVNPNTVQGVCMNTAPALTYTDTDTESLLRFLAFQLYAGGGAHSLFFKTWGAGLAYGNGLAAAPNGLLYYYADKVPELPQTLRFVAEQLRQARRDPGLADYAIAQAFSSRADGEYESRGEAMADDLADGIIPDQVRRFRRAILALRDRPDLADALYARMLPETAKVLPGLGRKGATVAGAVYFIIGAEAQFALYEDYLRSVDGPQTRLYRLYPRDFWMPALPTQEAQSPGK